MNIIETAYVKINNILYRQSDNWFRKMLTCSPYDIASFDVDQFINALKTFETLVSSYFLSTSGVTEQAF